MAMNIKENAPYRAFAENLIRLRKEARLSRKVLAKELGISPRSIVNYESGERIPFGDLCVKMAHFFGLSVEELLQVDNPEREMINAETVEDMDRIFGRRSAEEAQSFLDNTQAFLAGGSLSPEATLDFCDVMRQVLYEAEIRAKAKYTPSRFRTPEWKDRIHAQRAETDQAVRKIRGRMDERAALREDGSTDGDD